jgi:hypothetical protein
LKDDVTFALLTVIFPHMVVMFNKINNLPRLEAILNGAQFPSPIVLIKCGNNYKMPNTYDYEALVIHDLGG